MLLLELNTVDKGLAVTPTAFKCDITLRGGKAEIIEQKFIEAIDTLVKFEDSLDQDEKDLLEKTRSKLR